MKVPTSPVGRTLLVVAAIATMVITTGAEKPAPRVLQSDVPVHRMATQRLPLTLTNNNEGSDRFFAIKGDQVVESRSYPVGTLSTDFGAPASPGQPLYPISSNMTALGVTCWSWDYYYPPGEWDFHTYQCFGRWKFYEEDKKRTYRVGWWSTSGQAEGSHTLELFYQNLLLAKYRKDGTLYNAYIVPPWEPGATIPINDDPTTLRGDIRVSVGPFSGTLSQLFTTHPDEFGPIWIAERWFTYGWSGRLKAPRWTNSNGGAAWSFPAGRSYSLDIWVDVGYE